MAVCNHLITERRICKILFGVLAVLLTPVRAQEKAPAGVAPAAPQPISLTQVAERSEELTRTLREISRRLPEDSDLAAFENNLREQDNLVRGRLATQKMLSPWAPLCWIFAGCCEIGEPTLLPNPNSERL